MTFEPRNVFITGGAGFIGANFVRHWLATPREGRVVVFDALTYAGNSDNLTGLDKDPRYVFVKGDICDEATVRALLEQHHIDTVVHFAAESHVDNSLAGPGAFIQTNIVGTYTILEAVREHGTRLHHISTDEVFGDLALDGTEKFTERTAYDPSSPYSASKAALVSLTRSAAMEYAEKSVRINAVAPGRVVTDMMLASKIMDMGAVAAGLPLRRMGRPEEVAEAVVWLASDAASFVVGHVLCTDGGFMAL